MWITTRTTRATWWSSSTETTRRPSPTPARSGHSKHFCLNNFRVAYLYLIHFFRMFHERNSIRLSNFNKEHAKLYLFLLFRVKGKLHRNYRDFPLKFSNKSPPTLIFFSSFWGINIQIKFIIGFFFQFRLPRRDGKRLPFLLQQRAESRGAFLHRHTREPFLSRHRLRRR